VCGSGEQRLVKEIVDVLAAGREELRVFLTKNTIPKNAAGHGDPLR
jgi:hypothetical protein